MPASGPCRRDRSPARLGSSLTEDNSSAAPPVPTLHLPAAIVSEVALESADPHSVAPASPRYASYGNHVVWPLALPTVCGYPAVGSGETRSFRLPVVRALSDSHR